MISDTLKEALDAGWNMMVGHVGEPGYRALLYRGSLFEAGPKVDATHRDLAEAVDAAARRALDMPEQGDE